MLHFALFTYLIDAFKTTVRQQSHESELEKYINSHNPQSNVDVDLLTKEFERKQSSRFSFPFYNHRAW